MIFKSLSLALLLTALARAGVVEVINTTENPLRFSTLAGIHDSWVPAKSSRRWMVPDTTGTVVYTVENIATVPPVVLGTLTVNPEKYYVAGYDVVSGFVSSERTVDASVIPSSGSHTPADVISWAKFGMLLQFGAEVAGLCLWALKVSKSSWSRPWGTKE